MRDHKEQLFVGGAHAVDTMLQYFPQRAVALWYTGESRGRRGELIGRAEALSIPVHKKKKETFKEISADANHQGVALVVTAQDYADWSDLLANPMALIMAFDQVTDPRNLGASLRTAEALGGTGALITKNRCARLGPTVCKTSVGASEIIPVSMETNLARALTVAKSKGLQVLGTAFDGQAPCRFDLTRPTILVVGSEGKGLRQSTVEACDGIVTIPMQGKTESLNASVAASILLYEASRQRHAARA